MTPIPLTLEQIRRQADATIPHARGCKKSPSECVVCSATMAFYAALPLDVLALVLEDRPTLKASK